MNATLEGSSDGVIGQKRLSDMQERRPRIAGVLPSGAPDYKSGVEFRKIKCLVFFLLRKWEV